MGAQNRPSRLRPQSGAWLRRAPRVPAFVNGYRSGIISPVNGAFTRDRRPDITVVPEATLGGTVDIQIEWRTSPSGAVVYTTTFLGAVAGTPQVLEPPANLSYFNWYYRARVGSVSGNVWSAWTGMQYLTIYPLPGFAHAYLDFNIGVENVEPVKQITVYADLNIGLAAFDEHDGFAYTDFNIGLEQKPRLGAEYLELNVTPVLGTYEPSAYMDVNITAEVPTPHIWYVQPQIGPEGLMFRIVGSGFGVSQGQYDGKVLLGGLDCPVVSWTDVPESMSEVVRITRANLVTGDINAFVNSSGSVKPGNYSTNSIIFEAGDYLEYDYRRISPNTYVTEDYFWTPYFLLQQSTGSALLPNFTGWNDAYGNILARPNIPAGQVVTRKFPVPAVFWGSAYRGVNWGWRYLTNGAPGAGVDPARPAHTVEIRNYVYRRADGTPKLWIFGEDGSSINLTTANGLVFTQGVSSAFDGFIDQGATNRAHQEVLALVPDGAESGMVQIVLEV